MKLQTFAKSCVLAVAALSAAALASADVVETRDGARLVGTISQIDGTHVTLKTEYAGTISVNQAEVVSITSDEPMFVRLTGGTVLAGTIASSGDGRVEVRGTDGTVSTSVGNIAMTWQSDGRDPAVAALDARWSYEVGVDVTGKSGNSEQLGSAIRLRAKLERPTDTLQFYAGYDRQEVDDEKSADQLRIGLDYANNFAGRYSWYVRNEGGFDRIKDIDLYNVAAAGIGYDFIKETGHTLTGRAGLSYRYEGYGNPATEDVSSAGLDFGLNQELTLAFGQLNNTLSFVPAFDDFGNYRATHESYFEIPITASLWKLRVGLSNDYNSQPGVGVEKLDTTYFTRLVLNWE